LTKVIRIDWYVLYSLDLKHSSLPLSLYSGTFPKSICRILLQVYWSYLSSSQSVAAYRFLRQHQVCKASLLVALTRKHFRSELGKSISFVTFKFADRTPMTAGNQCYVAVYPAFAFVIQTGMFVPVAWHVPVTDFFPFVSDLLPEKDFWISDSLPIERIRKSALGHVHARL
jgi:hypothetical protein